MHRGRFMLEKNEGLTCTYNRLHDPHEKSEGILELRRLHSELDCAVLRAYGWDDLAATATCEFLLDYEEEGEEVIGHSSLVTGKNHADQPTLNLGGDND